MEASDIGICCTTVVPVLESYQKGISQVFLDHISRTTRVGVCISGELRALANVAHMERFKRTFYDPLVDFQVDTYLNLQSSQHTQIIKTINSNFKPVYIEFASFTCSQAWCNDERCIRTGYEQFKRLEMCMVAIENRERKMKFSYDWLMCIRPDLVFYSTLPRATCWNNLRRDIVWDSHPIFYENISIGAAAQTDFVLDWFKLFPRSLASAYMKGIPSSYERCIPEAEHSPSNFALSATELPRKVFGDEFGGGCGEKNWRWRWNECRALLSLQSLGVLIGKITDEALPSEENGIVGGRPARTVSDLLRCRNSTDIWCKDSYVSRTGLPLQLNILPRASCFPSDAYSDGEELTK